MNLERVYNLTRSLGQIGPLNPALYPTDISGACSPEFVQFIRSLRKHTTGLFGQKPVFFMKMFLVLSFICGGTAPKGFGRFVIL